MFTMANFSTCEICLKKKRELHLLATRVFTTKKKKFFTAPAADARSREILFNPARRFNEIDCVVTMFFKTGGNGQNVWIEDNIVCWEPCAFGQQIVSARANLDFALKIIRLSSFIERHYDGSGAVSPD